MAAVLQGWHFQRVVDPDPGFAMTWEGPLGRTVRIMGTSEQPRVTMKRTSTGEVMFGLFDTPLDADTLDHVLGQ